MPAKPLAALTSGLLARKGQAKPAMRPQGFAGFGPRHDDLGWNDMGYEAAQPASAPEPPVVVLQQQQLARRVKARAPKPEAAVGKAAFTLRLDAERHLRLRLASAVRHQSSQQLVTEALDRLLAEVPGLDALVEQAKKHGKN